MEKKKAIECPPTTKLSPFKRDLDSPTKSLQFEPVCDQVHQLSHSSRRSSSLCIWALKAAARSKATSTPHLKTSEASSLSSMISLPGVPPVQGVNDVQQVQLQRQKSKKRQANSNSTIIAATSNARSVFL